MSIFRPKRKEALRVVNVNIEQPQQESLPLDTFERELTHLINKYSLESLSNTPDFILAYYVKDCLIAFQNAQNRRKEWFSAREEGKHRDSQAAPLS